jgi:hypothetical protein
LILVASDHSIRPKMWLEVISVTQRKKVLRLLLPFNGSLPVFPRWKSTEVEPVTAAPTGNNTIPNDSWYYRDSSSERVGVLHFMVDQGLHELWMAISTNQLLRLLRSESKRGENDLGVERAKVEDCKTLAWPEWGPKSTRWFNVEELEYMSIRGSNIYLSDPPEEFIDANRLSTKWSSAAKIAFFDFNSRIIRRYRSGGKDGKSDIQDTESGMDSPEDGLIAQHVITEETVVNSPILTEEIHSHLPFRISIRRNVNDWRQCPNLGTGIKPFAVFTVSMPQLRGREEEPIISSFTGS